MSLEQRSRLERWKNILQIAWPLIIANSFWNLQLTIDRIYLGHYSTESLGAAMAVMGVFWTPMALLQQTAAYVTTFVAQYFGANHKKRIGPAFWQALYISVIGGALFLLLIFVADPFFAWMGHSASLQKLETEYFIALSYSALPTAIVAAASGFFTGLGRTQTIIWINCVGLIANVFFDYLFIFGNWGFPEMGIAGAGYATALANWVGAFYGLYLVLRKKHEAEFRVLTGWKLDPDLMRRFVRFGLPSGLQWALEGLAFTVFLILVGRMADGDAALSSTGIAMTVMMLAILPTLGVAQAVSVLVGQHLGNEKPQLAAEATWSGLQVSAIYIFAMGLTFALFPEFYLSWFYNESDAVIWSKVSIMVPILLLYVAVFTTFDSMNLIFSFALKGAGDTRFVSLLALVMPWPIMVLPTWWMKDWDGAVYYAWGVAGLYIILQAFVFLWRFIQGKWQTMSVIR